MFTLARRTRSINVWPGFVDALASVLLVFIFMLLIFVLAQFNLSGILAGREAALQRLTHSINELAHTLSLERAKSTSLSAQVKQLTGELHATLAAKESLSAQLQSTTQRAARAEAQAADLSAQLGRAEQTVSANKETIELKLREIASLQQDIATLRQMSQKLEARVAALSGQLGQRTTELGAARDRSRQLQAQLASQQERTLLAQTTINRRDIRIADLTLQIQAQNKALTEQRQLSARTQDRVSQLNQQIGALRQQLAEVSAALELSKTKVKNQQLQIADLGKQLNVALVRKVQELNRYRSEFFGRLRAILGNRKDIRIVGDRFVFQSEILFATGSATLGAVGREQMTGVAQSLKELEKRIPKDIQWVLRVDGHTDRRPIHTAQFPSNWELSTARALSIVRFLISQGIPPNRLVAAGFGEYHPLDPADTPEAWRRNRRIELRLTPP